MKSYILQLRGTVSTMLWRYEFQQPSDALAVDYSSRILLHDPCAAQAMGADLFNLETDLRVQSFEITHAVSITARP